ncbi:MAG: MATE family efflux transporter [Acidobacteriota bacterium]
MASPTFDRRLVDGPIHVAVWALAWPTILQNLVAGLQGIVDHAMVGHFVGFTGNAAIGVSWQIFLVVVVFISSLFTGMGVLVARFAGAGRADKVARVVYQAFWLSLFLSLLGFAPLGYFAAPVVLDMVNAAPEVQAEALPYLRILFVFSLGNMYFFMIGGALRAAGDAKTPLRLGVAMTILNLLLNAALIPHLGTAGAALGTVISGLAVSAYALVKLFSGGLVIDLRPAITWRIDREVVSKIFRFGLPTGFQGIAMNIGGVLLVRFVGSLEQSAAAQAAYAVGYSQLFSLISWTSVALMAASSTITGQSLGAGRPERAELAPRASWLVGLGVAVPLGLLFLLLPRQLLGIFGMDEPAVLTLGSQLLVFLAVSGLFLTGALAYTGALQGSGDTRSPMYISIFAQLLLPIALCAGFQATVGLEPWHIWGAIVTGHFTRCSLSVFRFRQGRWQDIDVELDADAKA